MIEHTSDAILKLRSFGGYVGLASSIAGRHWPIGTLYLYLGSGGTMLRHVISRLAVWLACLVPTACLAQTQRLSVHIPPCAQPAQAFLANWNLLDAHQGPL